MPANVLDLNFFNSPQARRLKKSDRRRSARRFAKRKLASTRGWQTAPHGWLLRLLPSWRCRCEYERSAVCVAA
jgi:hypothetical protein